jgi:pyrroloquinoline quinone biosynthesis protein B
VRVVILGSAAGGGVPQWNCGCENCRIARERGVSRTQSSLAISADGERWVLLNASPDLRQQLTALPALWPRGTRQSPIAAVILTDAEIDHTLGLMLLRESGSHLVIYAPAGVNELLCREWPLYRVLESYAGVMSRPLGDGAEVTLGDGAGRELGLTCVAVALARRPPRFAPNSRATTFEVGLRIRDERNGATFVYIPTAAAVDPAVRALGHRADLLCFDGTFWSDHELGAVLPGAPTAREMGHVPLEGPDGSLALLPTLGARRTVLVHINNTNPILRDSPERARVTAAGIEIGDDGMMFDL